MNSTSTGAKRITAAATASISLALLATLLFGCMANADSANCVNCGPGPGIPQKLTITIESRMDPEVGEEARLLAVADDYGWLITRYAWKVTGPDGLGVVIPGAPGGERIHFTLDHAGSYTIECTASIEGDRELKASAALPASGGPALTYTARILPPPASGAPPVDWVVTVDGADKTGLHWVINEGVNVTLGVANEASTPLPSFIRLTRPNQREQPRDLYLPLGEGTLKLSGSYDALVIPDGTGVAPAARAGLDAATVAHRWQTTLDAGLAVRGTVGDASGAPLPGAVVTLRTRDAATDLLVPSTVARCATDGSFTARARPGDAELTVTPPAASGYPLAVIEAARGLSLAAAAEGWSFRFKPLKLARLSATVVRADGLTPASATVILRSKLPIADVGQLEVGGASFTASGRYHRVLETAADGSGAIVDSASGGAPDVPVGSYELVLLPGEAEVGTQGRAVRQLVVTESPGPAAPLALAARVKLTGNVVGPDGAPARARVSARGALETFSGETDEQGRFLLDVVAGQAYEVVIRPAEADGTATLAPMVLPGIEIQQDGRRLEQLILPRAVTLSGQLKTPGNAGISGALIRIRCTGGGCKNPGVDVNEARTGADGSFRLRVPRP